MSLPVEVVRSTRRRKTVQAVVVDGRIRVHLPAWMSEKDERTYVDALVARLQKHYRSEHVDLEARSAELAARYDLPAPRSVRWSDRQRARWGSCTVATGDIRLSLRLADWPSWVLDYVIVHELAHLIEANHSPLFHELVSRYPKAERAKGFLIAKGLYGEDDAGHAVADPGLTVPPGERPASLRNLDDALVLDEEVESPGPKPRKRAAAKPAARPTRTAAAGRTTRSGNGKKAANGKVAGNGKKGAR